MDLSHYKGRKKADYGIRVCAMCGIEYKPTSSKQLYCGSWVIEQGCSLKYHLYLIGLSHKRRYKIRKLEQDKVEERRRQDFLSRKHIWT